MFYFAFVVIYQNDIGQIDVNLTSQKGGHWNPAQEKRSFLTEEIPVYIEFWH